MQPTMKSLLQCLAAVVALATACGPWPSASAQTISAVERLSPAAGMPAAPTGQGEASPVPASVQARAASQPLDGAHTLPKPQQQRPATDFERYASTVNGGRPLWRFGTEPRPPAGEAGAQAGPLRVPPDYPVQVGDELLVHVWGSVEGEWRLRVDLGGRIVLPRVGPVSVAGLAAAQLQTVLRERLQSVYKSFDLGVAVTAIAPILVSVTGFVEHPGDRVLPGLSTLSRAVARLDVAATGGSLRRVMLRRAGADVLAFDRYALLAQGQNQQDPMLLPGDVIHVEAVGPQVAVLGAVNRTAVFETLPGHTLADALQLAGGFSAVADGDRVELERRRGDEVTRVAQLRWPEDASFPVADGDLLRVPSRMEASRPSLLGNKRVRIEGEVMRPGDYVLPPGASLADAVAAAGGATSAAFPFGTELRRERVRLLQEANYLRAIQELEAEAARLSTVRGTGGDNALAQEAAVRELLNRLRSRRPEGRLVLDIQPAAEALPALTLEDGDFVRLPPRSQSVGVFGTVFNAGSFVHDEQLRLGDFVARAGGPTAAAEAGAMFVVRANGSVLSARQGGWWNGRSEFESQPALPGDTVFVPERLDRVTFVQGAKDWTQILYQLGIGLAALMTIR